jgi:hypothetical protein
MIIAFGFFLFWTWKQNRRHNALMKQLEDDYNKLIKLRMELLVEYIQNTSKLAEGMKR